VAFTKVLTIYQIYHTPSLFPYIIGGYLENEVNNTMPFVKTYTRGYI
jgi:hypothetical protein